MREILFRGKAIADNKWRYGGIHTNDEGKTFIIIGSYPDKKIGWSFSEVDPNTVCQYLPLWDKNGNKIWEHDIVKAWIDLGPGGEAQYIFEVLTDPAHGTNIQLWNYKEEGYLPEVLGNRFDNPELIPHD